MTLGVTRSLIKKWNKHELLQCVPGMEFYEHRDLQKMVSSLGFATETLCHDQQQHHSNKDYADFIMGKLKQGTPVIFGVFVKGSGDMHAEGYEHIVLVVGRKGDKWLINDHYRSTPTEIPMEPMSKAACERQSAEYCVPADRWGQVTYSALAVHPPAVNCPARLSIDGCEGGDGRCHMSEDGETNGWVEPNWSIHGIEPVTYLISAMPAKPFCQLSDDKHYTVVKATVLSGHRNDPARPLRAAVNSHGSPFEAAATECYDWDPGSTSLPIGSISSRDSVFVKFVERGSEEHLAAKCPEVILP